MISDVAALYVDPRGPYPKLVEHWWDEQRDARTYAGPWPVVAHPPCGPWGRLRHMCTKQDPSCGPAAVLAVRTFCGVLEHPALSRLWEHCHMPRPGELPDGLGGWTLEVDQVNWGHVARKRTWLYIVGIDRRRAPSLRTFIDMPMPRQPTHQVSRDAKRARRNGYTLKRTSSRQNRETPVAFAEWLISLAATAAFGCPQVGCPIAGRHEHRIEGPGAKDPT